MTRTPSIRQMIDEGYVGAADILPDEIMEMIDRGEIDLDDVLPRDDELDDAELPARPGVRDRRQR